MKRHKNPTTLTGRQIWNLHKGDGKGDDIPIDFIENYAKNKNIHLNRDEFEQIYLSETEKSLKNLHHQRHENTKLIDISIKLKNNLNIPSTDDSFKYGYRLNTQNRSANSLTGNSP
jgi:hypothetical protein